MIIKSLIKNNNSVLNTQSGGGVIKPISSTKKKPGFGVRTKQTSSMEMGMGQSSMMSYKAQEKQQELEMKKQAEGEPDLGYIGSFSGMKCGELNETGDRLDCHYSKLKYEDVLAKKDVKRKALQNKRQDRHKYAIKRMCMEESPLLCSLIDSDELPKEPEPKCIEFKACPEPPVEVMDIITDFKNFYNLILKSLYFFFFLQNKRSKNSKIIEKLKKKLQKELDDIKKEYDALLQEKTQPAAKATKATATKAPATNSPATKAPATNAPATKAPATNKPTAGGSRRTKRYDIYKKSRKNSKHKSINNRKSHKSINNRKSHKSINNRKSHKSINNKKSHKSINNRKSHKSINNRKTHKSINNRKTHKSINNRKSHK